MMLMATFTFLLLPPLQSCWFFMLMIYLSLATIMPCSKPLSLLKRLSLPWWNSVPFNFILVSNFNEHIMAFFYIKQNFVSPFFMKPRCWIVAQFMCLSMKELFSNMLWTLFSLIPFHIDNLLVNFYISFACIVTLLTLLMSFVDTCKHLKLPIFKPCFLSFTVSIVTFHMESIT
jgi:hypothetical protein